MGRRECSPSCGFVDPRREIERACSALGETKSKLKKSVSIKSKETIKPSVMELIEYMASQFDSVEDFMRWRNGK